MGLGMSGIRAQSIITQAGVAVLMCHEFGWQGLGVYVAALVVTGFIWRRKK